MDGFVFSLLRATCCTGLGATLAATFLNDERRARSPAFHRFVWCLVLVQGWAHFSYTVAIPFSYSDSPGAATIKAPFDSHPSTSSVVATKNSRSVNFAEAEGSISPSTFTAIAWLAGIVAMVLYYLRQYCALSATIPLGRALTNSQWIAEWKRTSRDFGVADGTQFRISDNLGPLCCFVPYFYLVIVPERLWSTLESWQRECVLRHELSHIVRHDLWKSLLIRLLALPQWFNPMAWKAVRAFDDAGEWACDDLVMRSCGRDCSTAYAATLMQIAETALTPLPSSLGAQGGQLTARIKRLVQPRFKEETRMRKMSILTMLCALFVGQSLRLVAVETSEQPAAVHDHERETASADGAKSHEAALARTGLVPYRVAPPDILRLTLTTAHGDRTEADHQVSPDGTISIAHVGQVQVAGKTLGEVNNLLNEKLADTKSHDRVTVDVKHANSKVYYVVLEPRAYGNDVFRFPCTGKEKVIDALAQIISVNGQLPYRHVWISRPSDNNGATHSILPVDWPALESGDTTTNYHNYHLYPGDRVFISETPQNELDSPLDLSERPSATIAQEPPHGMPPVAPQVLIEWELLEITATDSLSLHTLIPTIVPDNHTDACVLSRQSLKTLKEELPMHGTIKTIGTPKIVTTSGRSASMSIGKDQDILVPEGGEHDGFVVVNRIQLGTMLDVTPTTVGRDRIRLDFRLATRHVSESTSVVVGGHRVPGLRSSMISRTAELNVGESLVALLKSSRLAKETPGDTYILALAHAELVGDGGRAEPHTSAIPSRTSPQR